MRLEVLIMGKINCRGHEKRIALCELYDIKPEFRIKQLSGITISDSGGRITDELFIFSAFSKQDGSFYDKIICGEPTAKDFLMITGADRPPLFNMLKSVSKPTKEKSSKEKKSSSPSESTNAPMYSKEDFSEWHPVNKALYNAIMILIICWGDVSGDCDLMIITDNGVVMRMPITQISTLKRATQGVRLINLKDDTKVATVALVSKSSKDEDNESEEEPAQ